jgi:hypothetical protein
VVVELVITFEVVLLVEVPALLDEVTIELEVLAEEDGWLLDEVTLVTLLVLLEETEVDERLEVLDVEDELAGTELEELDGRDLDELDVFEAETELDVEELLSSLAEVDVEVGGGGGEEEPDIIGGPIA